MTLPGKKILIIDEEGFSRVCSAILEREGYVTTTITGAHEFSSFSDYNDFGLVITSYPYDVFLLEEIKKRDISTIILSDHINKGLISTLEGLDHSDTYCMIKPLDYSKFRSLIKQLMSSDAISCGEYNIVSGQDLQ